MALADPALENASNAHLLHVNCAFRRFPPFRDAAHGSDNVKGWVRLARLQVARRVMKVSGLGGREAPVLQRRRELRFSEEGSATSPFFGIL